MSKGESRNTCVCTYTPKYFYIYTYTYKQHKVQEHLIRSLVIKAASLLLKRAENECASLPQEKNKQQCWTPGYSANAQRQNQVPALRHVYEP